MPSTVLDTGDTAVIKTVFGVYILGRGWEEEKIIPTDIWQVRWRKIRQSKGLGGTKRDWVELYLLDVQWSRAGVFCKIFE